MNNGQQENDVNGPSRQHHYRKSLSICHSHIGLSSLMANVLHFDDEFLFALSNSKLQSLKIRLGNTLRQEDFNNFIITIRECRRRKYLKEIDFRGWNLSKYPSSSVGKLIESIGSSFSAATTTATAFASSSNNVHEYNERCPLVRLDLSGCGLNNDNIRTLSKQLQYFSNLQTLDISWKQSFSDKSIVDYFLPALQKHEKQSLMHLEN